MWRYSTSDEKCIELYCEYFLSQGWNYFQAQQAFENYYFDYALWWDSACFNMTMILDGTDLCVWRLIFLVFTSIMSVLM